MASVGMAQAVAAPPVAVPRHTLAPPQPWRYTSPRTSQHTSRLSFTVVSSSGSYRFKDLGNGFTLFTFPSDEEAWDLLEKSQEDSSFNSEQGGEAGQDQLPCRYPSRFRKASPIPAAKARFRLKSLEHEAASKLRKVQSLPPIITKAAPAVPRPAGAFRKRSPVLSSLERGLFHVGRRQRVKLTKGTGLISRFSKRSPVKDFRSRRAAKAGLIAALERRFLPPAEPFVPPVARLPSLFKKRSPVVDFWRRLGTRPPQLRTRQWQAATTQEASRSELHLSSVPVGVGGALPRLPTAFKKRSPVLAFSRGPTGDSRRGIRTSPAVHSRRVAKDALAHPPSQSRKRSPAADDRARAEAPLPPLSARAGARRRARAQLKQQTASPQGKEPVLSNLHYQEPHLMGLEVKEGSQELEISFSDGGTENGADTAAGRRAAVLEPPERKPSRFRKKRRPLPSGQTHPAASELNIQAEPNGTPIHNRLPIAQPLAAQTPALMEGWSEEDSAADGLVTSRAEGAIRASDPAVNVAGKSRKGKALGATAKPPVKGTASTPIPLSAEPGPVQNANGALAVTAQDTARPPWGEQELPALTVAALREIAKAAGLKGYTRLKKAELIQLLEGLH